MLVNMNDVLLPARKGRYAVGLFNAVNLEMARGILQAAEHTGSPVIMGTAEVLLPYGPLEELSYFLIPMAKKAKVPVVIHLDHGLSHSLCLKALELGFSSIMYDCSTDPYEDNVRKVREMAEIAHGYGATIEGELGHVGNNGDGTDPSQYFTDPEMARDFVTRTGVDALAIAVGNAHGAYKLPPKLDFERIRAIAGAVNVPLVLHGGSGLSDDDFRRAIREGICKVNIFTDINSAAAAAVRRESTADAHCESASAVRPNAAAPAESPADGLGLTDLIPAVVEAVQVETEKKLQLFGSVGKAGN